jgi:glycine betaine/choline ABC-type transport system substrate-binding protein
MGRTKIIAGLTLLFGLVGCSSRSPSIRVGSKNFTEQVVLGEIIAEHLEQRLKQ